VRRYCTEHTVSDLIVWVVVDVLNQTINVSLDYTVTVRAFSRQQDAYHPSTITLMLR